MPGLTTQESTPQRRRAAGRSNTSMNGGRLAHSFEKDTQKSQNQATPDDHGLPKKVDDAAPISSERIAALVLAYLKHAPLALSLRELNRLLAIETLPARSHGKIIDVGCGDGFWWTHRNRKNCRIFGIDINDDEVRQARKHIEAEICDVAHHTPFAGHVFDEAIGNCSLEHVRDVEAALKNIRRSTNDTARLILFVPSRDWALQGYMQRFLLRRAPRLAMSLAGALNGFFQHWHIYDVPHWKNILARSGWRVTEAHGLGNERSEFLFRLFLPQSLLSFLTKKTVGIYPSRAFNYIPDTLLRAPQHLLTWALNNPLVPPTAPTAYEYMLVAQADKLA